LVDHANYTLIDFEDSSSSSSEFFKLFKKSFNQNS
jgi:hypothetical protein